MIKSGNTVGIIEAILLANDYVKYMIENDVFINEIDVEAAYTPVKNKTEVKAKSKPTKSKKIATPKTSEEVASTNPSMVN